MLDPNRECNHIDLELKLIQASVLKKTIERFKEREMLNITATRHNHNALSDALDLYDMYMDVQKLLTR